MTEKKLLEKIELYRFAYTSNGKKMVDLRSFMRSKSYDDQDYLTQLRVLDYVVVDMCPLVNK